MAGRVVDLDVRYKRTVARVTTRFSIEGVQRTTTSVSGEQITADTEVTKAEECCRRLRCHMEVAKTRKKHRHSGSPLITKRFCFACVDVFTAGSEREGSVDRQSEAHRGADSLHAAAALEVHVEGPSDGESEAENQWIAKPPLTWT